MTSSLILLLPVLLGSATAVIVNMQYNDAAAGGVYLALVTLVWKYRSKAAS